jgi:hypothetical protein
MKLIYRPRKKLRGRYIDAIMAHNSEIDLLNDVYDGPDEAIISDGNKSESNHNSSNLGGGGTNK